MWSAASFKPLVSHLCFPLGALKPKRKVDSPHRPCEAGDPSEPDCRDLPSPKRSVAARVCKAWNTESKVPALGEEFVSSLGPRYCGLTLPHVRGGRLPLAGARHCQGQLASHFFVEMEASKVRPRRALVNARNIPPCASTIERQIDRPIPMPDVFVV
jgi:hypothetical protein